MSKKSKIFLFSVVYKNNNTYIKFKAELYEIPCLDCKKKNICVTLPIVLLDEFMCTKKNFKRADINNGLVKHNLETNLNFNFKDSKFPFIIKKNPEN